MTRRPRARASRVASSAVSVVWVTLLRAAVMAFVTVLAVLGPAREACAYGAGSPPAPLDAPEVAPNVVGAVALPALPVDYEVQHLGWWTLAYPASARDRVLPLVQRADAWRAQLTTDFGRDVLTSPIEVRVARSWDEMTALVPAELGVPPYASGVTYVPSPRLVLLTLREPSGGEATDLETVFHHELSHIALADATLGHPVPRWFNEGLAIHESGESPLLRMRELWDATLFRQLLPLSDLDGSFPAHQGQVNIAYAESADVVRFLLRGQDRVRFVSLLGRLREGVSFDRALGDAYGTDVRSLEFQWREECAKRNTFAPMLASGSFIWVLAFVVLVLGYRRRRRDTRATLARWEREERVADASLAVPVAAEDESLFTDPARALAGLPKVEHEGDWHTLH